MSDLRPAGGTSAARFPSPDELRSEARDWAARPRARGTWLVAEHLIRTMRAYGWTIIVNALGQPLLYLLGLAVGLAALIDAPVDDGGAQVPYLVFVAPALLATAAISVGINELTYPIMAGFEWRRHFFGFSASPLTAAQIANGVVVAATARMLLSAGLYYLFVWIFFAVFAPGDTTPATAWLAVPIGLLGGLAFGAPLMAYAASLETDGGQFAAVQRFVFMPMFLFSGTFYPLANLPVWLQWIGWVSPLWHATELGRIVTYPRDADPAAVLVHIAYLLILAVVGILFAHRVFARRLAA